MDVHVKLPQETEKGRVILAFPGAGDVARVTEPAAPDTAGDPSLDGQTSPDAGPFGRERYVGEMPENR